ncbi:hypothetical protein Taro_001394 [Colocasia esculenta]|uniref:X8 domain-containing protein n=1 Tax=Colocasia esculenta TaxID=4460 RepID=A0A843THY9_COLES|nr:hypothetical protein [Colocasia esculenta]
MAALVLWVLISAAFISGSDATWCVCRSDAGNAALQKTLDYACGTGADCTPILQNGACYQPNTVPAHCSYAANSFFQRKGQAAGSCDFSGTATITTTDPSYSGCAYPSTASSAGTGTGTGTPATTTPGTTATAPPPPGTPTIFTPPGSSTNGVLGGLGPSGAGVGTGISPDGAGLPTSSGRLGSIAAALVTSGLVLLRAWRC